MVLYLGLDYKDFLSVFGTGAIITTLIFLVAAFLIGDLLGGPSKNIKLVMGFRNYKKIIRRFSSSCIQFQNRLQRNNQDTSSFINWPSNDDDHISRN